MRDLKYIIKRIIIGVGIVLVLSCLNGCKVKALTLFDGTEIPDVPSVITENDYPFYISLYDSSSLRLIYTTNNNIIINNNALNMTVPWRNGSVSYVYSLPITQTLVNNKWGYNVNNNAQWTYKGTVASGYGTWWQSDNETLTRLRNGTCDDSNYLYCAKYFNKDILYANGNIANNLSLYSSYLPSQAPEFISFNAIPITTNNVITSYTVQPEFSNFDTENYVYQYSFDTNRWLSLTENEQILRINNNSTIYVRVKDKNTDEYIDGETLIISSIGTFFNNETYDISFSGDYRTENYLNNNTSSKSQSTIVEYQIYINYFPKSSILKYQYQYVENGNSFDDNNWETLSTSDNGSITYVASENGTLFARILDSDDNVLKSSTLTVNSIGLLAFDNNEKGINNFFDKLRNKIRYGGAVSSLFILPVSFFSNLYNSMDSSNICSNIQLGSLLGTNLSLPCVDIPRYLGNNVYNIIDFIFSFILLVGIFRFVIKKYNKFISMEDIGDDL